MVDQLDLWLGRAQTGDIPMGVAYNILTDWKNDRKRLKKELDSLFSHHTNTKDIVMRALILLHDQGGSITSRPGEHRKWKIKTEDYVGESVSLVRACKGLVDNNKDLEEGQL